ncbi:hypothetical protein [Streptomyces sp. NPDC005423]|uniref:hypothetical protein n=1 Tax=Streptomyces sp. NPDC005423 TaxID=3155343 RepID=UPI0033B3F89A
MSGPRTPAEAPPAADSVTDVVRWAAFSCVLVPVVLLWYGTSLAGATGTALGLAAVTAVCRVLLRRSEHGAARLVAEEGERGEKHEAHEGYQERAECGADAPHQGRRHRAEAGSGAAGGAGARRGGRHTGGNTPVN